MSLNNEEETSDLEVETNYREMGERNSGEMWVLGESIQRRLWVKQTKKCDRGVQLDSKTRRGFAIKH